MLGDPQHERKIINDFKFRPFVLSTVEGLRWSFFSSLLDNTGRSMLRPTPITPIA